MRRRKRMNKILLLLLLLLGLGVGFAAIATTLKINGIANITKPTWSIYWANPVVTTGSVTNTLPTIEEDTGDPENTKVSWTATLALPGDYYEFTIDAVNAGSIDAMITNIEPAVTDGTTQIVLPDYIEYSVTYDDGSEVALNQLLEAASSQKYKVRIYYDIAKMTASDLENMPAGGLSYRFTLSVTYGVVTDKVYKPAFRVGEYFIMEPDAEYATTSYAGFSGSTPTADQTLWRVLKVNASGTVEAISEYISTEKITIENAAGYKNYIAGLEDIASCYAKSGYTIATREIGYGGQTPIISDTYAFNGTNGNAPSTISTPSPTSGNGQEYGEGVLGDTLYLRDYQLVMDVYNSFNASTISNNGSTYDYWNASRKYVYSSRCQDYTVRLGGGTSDKILRSYGRNGWNDCNGTTSWRNYSGSASIRPIITLRSGITTASGEGSREDPYILN